MELWGQMYDRIGHPRYAINIIHACSNLIDHNATDADILFAAGFDRVAAEVLSSYNINIGFTLDTISNPTGYAAFPKAAGHALEQTASVLAIQGFASEVFSGLIKNSSPTPYDNNVDQLETIANWKRQATSDWVSTGVPVILDVSNGYDGRIVWGNNPKGFWGDNMDYKEDRWRNWLSQIKGPGIRGITFDAWNGYTEGFAAVPTREHGFTVYNWLKDLLEPLPWEYSHMHYVNGAATHRVFGAICEKWIALGADRGFGAPISDELPSALGRMQYFSDGKDNFEKAIYWSASTGAHEVHGKIARAYREAGGDAGQLGLPISDEQSNGVGRISYFQYGTISWIFDTISVNPKPH